MAPSQEEWDRLDEAERAAVVAALPGRDVHVERDRLRFYAGTALLLESEELIARLEQMLDDVTRRADEEARLRADEEARLRAEEARLRAEEAARREAAESEVARLRAEIERLTKK